MGIFKRMKRIVEAKANGFLDQVEQPIDMLDQYIREAERDFAKGQEALANQIYLEKKQAFLIEQTKETVAKRARQARLAVDRGEDGIAKIALQEKIIQEEKLMQYQEQSEAIKAQTVSLNEKLKELHAKLEEFKHRKLLLTSKVNVMNSLKRIDETFNFFNTDQIAKGFSRVEDRILMLESELEAQHQFFPSQVNANTMKVDSSFQEKVEKQLEELKSSNPSA